MQDDAQAAQDVCPQLRVKPCHDPEAMYLGSMSYWLGHTSVIHAQPL